MHSDWMGRYSMQPGEAVLLVWPVQGTSKGASLSVIGQFTLTLDLPRVYISDECTEST